MWCLEFSGETVPRTRALSSCPVLILSDLPWRRHFQLYFEVFFAWTVLTSPAEIWPRNINRNRYSGVNCLRVRVGSISLNYYRVPDKVSGVLYRSERTLLHKILTVQISSATRDMMLIQQNKYCWISHRSGVAELVWTVNHKIANKVLVRIGVRVKCIEILHRPHRRLKYRIVDR